MESVLIAAAGICVMLAVGAYEKWKRRTAPSRAKWREPAPGSWRPAAADLARAVSPLSATLEAFRDENDEQGMVALVRGLDPSITLRSTGRTTGDVETGHLGFDRQLYAQGNTDHVRALLDAVQLRQRRPPPCGTRGHRRRPVPLAGRHAGSALPGDGRQRSSVARR